MNEQTIEQFTVDAVSEECAFLKKDRYDVATLRRVMLGDVDVADYDFRAACFNNFEWQSLVDLIAAAPEMLRVCRAVLDGLSTAGSAEELLAASEMAQVNLRSAIAKATGKDA